MKCLYEILVPQTFNNGEFIPVEVHNMWDSIVNEISKGMTISRSAKGVWVSSSGTIEERMVPVKIFCTPKEMKEIAIKTKKFYSQEKVLYYKVSNEVYFV